MLWLNLPDPRARHGRKFENVGKKTGTHDGGWGWGAKFADFNNDGRLDILEANGFVTGPDPNTTYWYDLQEMVTQLKNATADAADWPVMGNRDLSGYERNRLWLQRAPENGELRFAEVAEEAGVRDLYNGRGVALLDADNDGDVDVYIANQGARGTFYRNLLYSGPHRDAAHWLGLDLVGDPKGITGPAGTRLASSLEAVGARVTVRCGGVAQRRDVQGGTGFASQSDRRLLFGLGPCGAPDSIEIDWPSGKIVTIGAERARGMLDRMTRVDESTE